MADLSTPTQFQNWIKTCSDEARLSFQDEFGHPLETETLSYKSPTTSATFGNTPSLDIQLHITKTLDASEETIEITCNVAVLLAIGDAAHSFNAISLTASTTLAFSVYTIEDVSNDTNHMIPASLLQFHAWRVLTNNAPPPSNIIRDSVVNATAEDVAKTYMPNANSINFDWSTPIKPLDEQSAATKAALLILCTPNGRNTGYLCLAFKCYPTSVFRINAYSSSLSFSLENDSAAAFQNFKQWLTRPGSAECYSAILSSPMDDAGMHDSYHAFKAHTAPPTAAILGASPPPQQTLQNVRALEPIAAEIVPHPLDIDNLPSPPTTFDIVVCTLPPLTDAAAAALSQFLSTCLSRNGYFVYTSSTLTTSLATLLASDFHKIKSQPTVHAYKKRKPWATTYHNYFQE